MPYYDKNHYVPSKLLKNFAHKNKNGSDVICVLNLINFAAYYAKPENAFCEKNCMILQCYGDHNTKPSENILHYVNKIWLPYARKTIKQIA